MYGVQLLPLPEHLEWVRLYKVPLICIFFSMKHACGDGGYLLTSTMIYHFLENDSFFLPGIIFGVAVTSPNACNSGKAFSRQGHPLFPSLKMHYVYYYLVKGEEELPALWRACPLSSETFSPSSSACAEV